MAAFFTRFPRVRRAFLAILAVLFCPIAAFAACPPPTQPADLVVALRIYPPFVVRDDFRGLRGMAIDMWESVAENLVSNGVISDYTFVECDIADQVQSLTDGSVDVAISPVMTITSARLDLYDFSVQYLESGIGIATVSSNAINFESAFWIAVETVTQDLFLIAIGGFLLFNLALAWLIARMWRNTDNAYNQKNRIVRALHYAVEATTRTTGLKGLSDSFRSLMGRIFEIAIVVLGSTISALVFGILATSFITSVGDRDALGRGEIAEMKIGTIRGSTSAKFVQAYILEGGTCVPVDEAGEDANCVTFPSSELVMKALDAGEIEAAIANRLALRYFAQTMDTTTSFDVHQQTFVKEPYAWGISRDRPGLKSHIDKHLIEIQRSVSWPAFFNEYLGEETSN